jgi:hypothetical protein
MLPTSNYTSMNPSQWKLGNIITTPKGLKKIEILTENGTKPIFQFWKAGDPHLRAPYGISEPYGSNGVDGATPAPPPPSATPGKAAPAACLRGMPLDLTCAAHRQFAQAVDAALTNLIFNDQARILGINQPDEKTPLGVLRRQFTSFCKVSKKPEYADTTRTKVNISNSEMGTRVSKLVAGKIEPATSADITRGCNTIPIIEIRDIWLAANGGMGVSGTIVQVLITSAGSAAPLAFEGLDMLVEEPTQSEISSSQPMELS